MKCYTRSKHFSVLSSYAFLAGTVGEFRIKCIKSQNESIGIMSNTEIIKEKHIYHSRHDAICFFYHVGGYLHETDGKMIANHLPKTKANDIITVKVDCVKWNIVFMLNDEVLGGDAAVIDIEPNQDYYPFVGFYLGDCKYELLV